MQITCAMKQQTAAIMCKTHGYMYAYMHACMHTNIHTYRHTHNHANIQNVQTHKDTHIRKYKQLCAHHTRARGAGAGGGLPAAPCAAAWRRSQPCAGDTAVGGCGSERHNIMGSAPTGSLRISCVLTGTFGVLPLTYFDFPKSARAYLFPQSAKNHYFCSGHNSVDPVCPQPRGAKLDSLSSRSVRSCCLRQGA